MDSLTHTVLGACVGEIIAGKRIGKHALFWGALANNIPDIDVLTSLWMSQADSLLAHRGFTHSVLFGVLFTPILAFVLKRFYKNKNMHFKDWLWIFGSGIFIHIFIDALTCYGTGWFEPFHHKRVSLNVLFVADPFYTLPFLVSFFVLVFLRKSNRKRKFWARSAIYISTVYVLVAGLIKWNIEKDFTGELKNQHIKTEKHFTTPAPLTSFLWFLVAKNDSGFYLAYRSVFDKTQTIDFTFKPQHANYLSSLEENPEVQKLIRFSKSYYSIERSGDSLFFNDIRFGTVGGWESMNNEFIFRYCLNSNADNDLVIQRGRMKSSGKDALVSLWKRVCGN